MSGDIAEDILVHIVTQLRKVFAADAPTPPKGGGTSYVRLFAGDSPPLAAWNAHSESCGCEEPFIWVRLIQRYHTKDFPAPFVGPGNCALGRALEIEAGVARCAVAEEEPDFKDYEHEAMVSLDDSRRLDAALCRAMACAQAEDDAVQTALGPVVPWGPQGAVIGNISTVWVRLP